MDRRGFLARVGGALACAVGWRPSTRGFTAGDKGHIRIPPYLGRLHNGSDFALHHYCVLWVDNPSGAGGEPPVRVYLDGIPVETLDVLPSRHLRAGETIRLERVAKRPWWRITA